MVSFATFVRRKSPLPALCYFYLISRYAVYTIYKSTQTAPSHLDIVFLVFANTNKITALINRMIQSVRDSPNALSGEIDADITRKKRILKIGYVFLLLALILLYTSRSGAIILFIQICGLLLLHNINKRKIIYS